MKVAANVSRSLARLATASKADFSTRSILLMMRILGRPTSVTRARIASVSSSRPRLASISTPTMSASCAPAQACVTMARSSRRLGAKMPGVSTKTSWERPAMAMPRSKARVVCTLCDTMATLLPTSALISVDLPTLGAPISAMNPHRVSSGGADRSTSGRGAPSSRRGAARAWRFASAIAAVRLDAGVRQHGGRGGLLGGAFRAAEPLRRRKVGKLDGHAKFRIMVGTLALDLTVGRCRQAARLRPLLQHRLRIAQRPGGRAHALAPEPLDQRGGGRIPAVDEHRSDHRLADVGQDRDAAAAAGISLRRAEPDRRAEVDRPPHIGAGLLAYQVGKTPRHLAFIRLGEGAKQHVGHHEPEHVIAEKLEPLVGAGAVARTGQRGNVGERLLEQGRVVETVADAPFEIGGGAAATFACFGCGLRGCRGGGGTRLFAVGCRVGRVDGSRCACSPAAHRTIVNSLFQRTDHGQRHTIQACSPSRMEKKMIWARPMIFSNGT